MESIKIKYDSALNRKIYRKYFDYVFNKSLENYAYKPAIWIMLTVSIIGIISKFFFLTILGSIVIVFGFLIYCFYKIRLNISFKKFIADTEKKLIEKDFTFSFDENEIHIESANLSNRINFSLLKKYVENDGDLYPFYENGEAFSIISTSIIGKEKYDLFKKILLDNIKKKA